MQLEERLAGFVQNNRISELEKEVCKVKALVPRNLMFCFSPGYLKQLKPYKAGLRL